MIAHEPPAPSRLDVPLVLKRTGEAFIVDFAGVVVGALALVALPRLLLHGNGEFDTLLTIMRAVLAMLYAALVSWGVVSRLRGRALPPQRFWREGLARAQPGLQVALLAGAIVVAGMTLHLFARHGTLAGWMLNSLLLTGGLAAVCALMPLVPVAVNEQLKPMAAFRRAAALTRHNRNRILGLALFMLLTLAPAAAVAMGFAGAAPPWASALFESLAWSLGATVSAVVYVGLEGCNP
ncbi:MAG: hypothetical protein H7268_00885 [Sandarakinorhabdus sp.]|nr:hypothetical protein [Sandarakinorhabdus sp.]